MLLLAYYGAFTRDAALDQARHAGQSAAGIVAAQPARSRAVSRSMSETGDIDALAAEYVLGTLDGPERAQAPGDAGRRSGICRQGADLGAPARRAAPDGRAGRAGRRDLERIKSKMPAPADRAGGGADAAAREPGAAGETKPTEGDRAKPSRPRRDTGEPSRPSARRQQPAQHPRRRQVRAGRRRGHMAGPAGDTEAPARCRREARPQRRRQPPARCRRNRRPRTLPRPDRGRGAPRRAPRRAGAAAAGRSRC